jgi:hypothetical protein
MSYYPFPRFLEDVSSYRVSEEPRHIRLRQPTGSGDGFKSRLPVQRYMVLNFVAIYVLEHKEKILLITLARQAH